MSFEAEEFDANESVENSAITSLNAIPSPLASSNLSIVGMDDSSFDSVHRNLVVLREKIVIVGDATVGKTAIAKAFISNGQNYAKDYLMTAGVDMNITEVPIPDTNVIVDLFIFDTGGQSIFNQRQMAKKFWKDCSFIVCMFDICSRKSLQNSRTWIEAVQSSQGMVGKKPRTILIANKIDLREEVSH